jgi:hypothetical protein
MVIAVWTAPRAEIEVGGLLGLAVGPQGQAQEIAAEVSLNTDNASP